MSLIEAMGVTLVFFICVGAGALAGLGMAWLLVHCFWIGAGILVFVVLSFTIWAESHHG